MFSNSSLLLCCVWQLYPRQQSKAVAVARSSKSTNTFFGEREENLVSNLSYILIHFKEGGNTTSTTANLSICYDEKSINFS